MCTTDLPFSFSPSLLSSPLFLVTLFSLPPVSIGSTLKTYPETTHFLPHPLLPPAPAIILSLASTLACPYSLFLTGSRGTLLNPKSIFISPLFSSPSMAPTSLGVKAKVLIVTHKTFTVSPPRPLRPHSPFAFPFSLCSSRTGFLVVPITGLCLRTFALASPPWNVLSPNTHMTLFHFFGLFSNVLLSVWPSPWLRWQPFQHTLSPFPALFFCLLLTTS